MSAICFAAGAADARPVGRGWNRPKPPAIRLFASSLTRPTLFPDFRTSLCDRSPLAPGLFHSSFLAYPARKRNSQPAAANGLRPLEMHVLKIGFKRFDAPTRGSGTLVLRRQIAPSGYSASGFPLLVARFGLRHRLLAAVAEVGGMLLHAVQLRPLPGFASAQSFLASALHAFLPPRHERSPPGSRRDRSEKCVFTQSLSARRRTSSRRRTAS